MVGSYDYDGLIKAFINQTSRYKTTASGRMWFRENTLYSYNTAVAVIRPELKVILVCNCRYSKTTSKQMNILHSYIPSDYTIFSTSDVFYAPSIVLQEYWDSSLQAITAYTRARTEYMKELHKQTAITSYKQALTYADYKSIDKRTKVYRYKQKVFIELLKHKLLKV